ncbi:MAG TPA: MauE/DoxX family redox-associated membrane protein [Candidatus Binatia bacterium]|jgi:hypothetical protein
MSGVAIDPAAALVLRACLTLLLAAAAFHKIADFSRFRAAVAGYRVLPKMLLAPATVAVPAVEASLAVALAMGLGAAGVATSLLMAGYAAAIAVNVARGRTGIDCGCTGPAFHVPLGASLVVRNGVVAVAAAALALPLSPRPLAWFDCVAVMAATPGLCACWLASQRLLATAPRAAALARLRR